MRRAKRSPRQVDARLDTAHGPLAYRLVLSDRRSMALEVHRDSRVVVRAPFHASQGEIERWMLRKQGWILQKQAEFTLRQPLSQPLSYQAGSEHLFQGQGLRLHLGWAARWQVQVEGDALWLCGPEAHSPSQTGERLQAWYRQQARSLFQTRVALWQAQAAAGQRLGQVRIRRMVRRWGSCSSKGDITLNTHLVKAPLALLDYVICHELCHLSEMNHSRRFYQLLDGLMPAWRGHEAELESWSSRLIPEA